MATRKAKMGFAIKRFKGFWNEFKKSKRGLTGVIIVSFFVSIAVFAPLVTPYDPIEPKKDKDKYPSQTTPPKIAGKLCNPAWYKYIPWIEKGSTQLEETFWVKVSRVGGLIFPKFGRLNVTAIDELDVVEGHISRESFDKHREDAMYHYISLAKAAIAPPQIDVVFPNETEPTKLPNPKDFWEPRSAAAVGGSEYGSPEYIAMRSFIMPIYEVFGQEINYVILKVTYEYSKDVTENLELVPDFEFSSEQTFNEEWQWTASTDSASAKYNSDEGYRHDGCVEVTYNPKPGETQAKVILRRRFEYPYWESPQSFWGHLSFRVEGPKYERVNLTVTVQRDGGELVPVLTLSEGKSDLFRHKAIWSTDPVVKETSNSLSPEKFLFSSVGNYTFAIEVSFNGTDNASVYLDNFNMLLYGNSFGILGTDNALGYPADIFSSLVYGTRVSLTVGVLSAVFSTIIGLFLGLVAGYVGGITDEGIMRFADLFLVLPTLPLFIILVVALKTVYGTVSMWNIILVLTLFGWMGFARSVRSMVLSLRERPFIEAAKAAGAGKFYIISRHILPNVFALVYITLATAVPGAIVTEASLSWLGLGDPSIASWGKLLYDFQGSGIAVTRGLTEYWFWMFPACISIALLATAFILMGYALDEILNPRLRMRR